MEVEKFEFRFTHKVSTYSIQVKRFLVDGQVHLWVLVKHPGTEDLIFTFYETSDPHKLSWHPMNDKRDELMKLMEKPLIKKVQELLKQGKVQAFEFYD